MIQLELRPELEAQIAAAAQARGLAVEQYIVETLEAPYASKSRDQRSIDEAIDRLQTLPQAHAAERHAAVEAVSQFAGQHGFTHGSEDLNAATHEGHKY